MPTRNLLNAANRSSVQLTAMGTLEASTGRTFTFEITGQDWLNPGFRLNLRFYRRPIGSTEQPTLFANADAWSGPSGKDGSVGRTVNVTYDGLESEVFGEAIIPNGFPSPFRWGLTVSW